MLASAPSAEEKKRRIRKLNDQLRTTFTDGRIVTSRAVADLPDEFKAQVLDAVRTFDAFNADNDPHQEHDCFIFKVRGERYMAKIDYYDSDMEGGSEDPADPMKTMRVMTIMFASDY